MDKQNSETDVFAYSPYHLYLFKQALRKGKEKDRRIRINIVGNYGQGKTCLAKRLAGLTCDGVEPTNGIDINLYKCKSFTGKMPIEWIKDEEQFFVSRMASVARSISKENDTQVVPVASTDSVSERKRLKSAKTTKRKRSHIDKHKPKRTCERTLEPGTGEISKTQMEDNTFIVKSSASITELKSFADKMETGENDTQAVLEFWDFGGQFIFYATHSIFHSRKAIYLLVFDLSLPLDRPVKDEDFLCKTDDKTMEDYARFWMESIHYFVGPEPPVILVGTHKDKLDGDEEAKLAAKDIYFDNVRHLFDNTELISHIQEEDYVVGNFDPSDADIDNLLQVILKKGINLTESSELPARWIPLEKCLRQEKHRKIVSFKRVREINRGNDCQLADDEELKLFLLYHHERGSLLYFDEESMSEHVVLDPKYLVDAFKCIITSKRFLTKNLSLRKEWSSLMTKGKLKVCLIDHVWNDNFKEHKSVLLEFLKKHCIISQIVEYNASSDTCLEKGWFIVPSLLKDNSPPNNDSLLEFLDGKSQTQIRFVMQFENPQIVVIIYHRLLAASIGKWPVVKLGKTKMLFRNLCVLQLGCNNAGITEMKGSNIELQVSNFCGKPVECHVSHSFRRFVETVVMHEFRKLKYAKDCAAKPYSRKYRCNHSKHGLEGSHRTRSIEQLENSDLIICPDNYSHQEFSRTRANAEWFLQKPNQEEFPNVSLCDRSLSKLACAVGENWELLASTLNLGRTDIFHIKEDNTTTIMRIYSMLLQWKDNIKDSATLDVFAEMLKSCPNLNVDWEIVNSVKDDLTRTSKSEVSDLNATAIDSGIDEVKVTDEQKPLKFIRTLTDRLVQSMPSTVDFECELSEDIPVKWFFNAQLIEPSSKFVMIDEGTKHKLEIKDVCSTDEGKYYVIAAGQKSSAELTVEETEEERDLRRLAENMVTITVFKEKTQKHRDSIEQPLDEIHGMYDRSIVPENGKPVINESREQNVSDEVADELYAIDASVKSCGYRFETLQVFVDETCNDKIKLKITEKLFDLDKTIRGCGYSHSTFNVNVERLPGEKETMDRKERITKFLEKHGINDIKLNIVSESVAENKRVGAGISIPKTEEGTEYHKGTLGGFASFSKEKETSSCALFSRHVAHGCIAEVYVDGENGKMTELGEILEDTLQAGSYDIAAAKIHDHHVPQCEVEFKNSENAPLPGKLYSPATIDSQDLQVHLLGSVSTPGLGIIKIPELSYPNATETYIQTEDRNISKRMAAEVVP